MGWFDKISKWIKPPPVLPKEYAPRFHIDDLVKRLGLTDNQLKAIKPKYNTFTVPKRSGGKRIIEAPDRELKKVQRLILRRVLPGLKSHPSVAGFEKGRSIVTHARIHQGADVVVRMDIRNFFNTTQANRFPDYFKTIGWDAECTELLLKLTTWEGALPQGAPTSPRLSNLINYQMDARLSAISKKMGVRYSRYADDLTFSFCNESLSASWIQSMFGPKTRNHLDETRQRLKVERMAVLSVIQMTRSILQDYGYRLHQKRKLKIHHRHQCQKVTGLVINEKVNLPRTTRRRLRAIEHRLAMGREATLTPEQLAGWKSLQNMIAKQSQ